MTSTQDSGRPIPSTVKKMLNQEGIIFVGTCDKAGIPNVSPRTAFVITDDDRLLWATWFMHKTSRNTEENNRVSVVVVDSEVLIGYQLKGHVEYVTEPDQIMSIMQQAIAKPRHANFNKIVQSQLGNPPLIERFVFEELYSLAPNVSSLTPLKSP